MTWEKSKVCVITYCFEIYKSYTAEDKSPHFLTIEETHMKSDEDNVVSKRCVEFWTILQKCRLTSCVSSTDIFNNHKNIDILSRNLLSFPQNPLFLSWWNVDSLGSHDCRESKKPGQKRESRQLQMSVS